MLTLPAVTLVTSIVGLALWFGGVAGLVYLIAYLLTLVPGLPIGWRLCGRRHPAGWVTGALIGYALSAIALWIPIYLGVPGRLSFALALAVLTAATWFLLRGDRDPLLALPAWTPRNTATWLLMLHLVPALLALPFGRVGESDRSGTRFYRAYFTADFVWHAALTQELARYDQPPVNPYLAPEAVHYYWTYFVVPAAIAGPEDARFIDVEDALRINATGTAVLLFSMIFFAAWSACGRAGPAAVASALALLAPSLEGTYEIVRLLRDGASLDVLRETNIDAVTAWPPFGGLRIDGLVRSMWWTPQHSTSMALGLIAVLIATRLPLLTGGLMPALTGGLMPALKGRPTALALVAGLALGLSVTMNPFLGAAFCTVYALAALGHAAAAPRPLAALAAQAPALLPVVLGLAFGAVNRMAEGAGGAVSIGWLYLARRSPVSTFVLSFGGLLLLVLVGLLPGRRTSLREAIPGISGLVVGIGLMYFVSITDRAWVGFRAGNVLLTTMPILAARGLSTILDRTSTVVAGAIVLVLLLAGAPTTIIDTYNAQDISNRRMGPGFLWTIPITPAQQSGFAWIRQTTPDDAVVQADPIPRGRQNWSVIPSFAGRRMAAGMPISLLEVPAYRERSDRVHALLTTLPAAEAHAAARALGIDYLWLDQDDAPTAADTIARFVTRPDLFGTVFRRGDVVIFRVAR
jgi:hypothetical protein